MGTCSDVDPSNQNINTSAKLAWKKNSSLRSEVIARDDIPAQLETVKQECEKRGYELLKRIIGKGAYATVYLAHVFPNELHTPSTVVNKLEGNDVRVVAIKVINKANVPGEFLRSFLPRELENHLTLPSHPNVVRCYEHFSTEEHEFLVLEYCSNGDLLDRINWHIHRKERGLPEQFSKKIFYQLCLAVKHCHDNYVVHRDLKCENVLLDEDDNVKLTGVILYAMVNGRLPFSEHKHATVFDDVTKDTQINKLKFQKSVSPDCAMLINKMMTDNPEKRPSIFKILKHMWVNINIKPAICTSSVTPPLVLNSPDSESAGCAQLYCRKSGVKLSTSPNPKKCGKKRSSYGSHSDVKSHVTHSLNSLSASGDTKTVITLNLNSGDITHTNRSTRHERQRSKSATTSYKLTSDPRPRTVAEVNVKPEQTKRGKVTSKSCPMYTVEEEVRSLGESKLKSSVFSDCYPTSSKKKRSSITKYPTMRNNMKIIKRPSPSRHYSTPFKLFDLPQSIYYKSYTGSSKCYNNAEKQSENVKLKTDGNKKYITDKQYVAKTSGAEHTKSLYNNKSLNPNTAYKVGRDSRNKQQSNSKSVSVAKRRNFEEYSLPNDTVKQRDFNNSSYVNIRSDDPVCVNGCARLSHMLDIMCDKNNSAPPNPKCCENEESARQILDIMRLENSTMEKMACFDVIPQTSLQLPLISCTGKAVDQYLMGKDRQYKLYPDINRP